MPEPTRARLHADVLARVEAFEPADQRQAHDRARTLDFLRLHPDAVDACCRAGHITATALVLRADRSQTLLTLHARVRSWLELGGHLEAVDADLPAAALREATEESGIDGLVIEPGILAIAAFDDVPCRRSPGATHFDVYYVVIAPAGARPSISAESLDLAWFDVDRLPEPLGPGVDRALALALSSSAAGSTPA